MADLYIGINKGVNISGTGSENGPIISSGSITTNMLLKIVGSAYTTAADRNEALQGLQLILNTLTQTGSWPLS